VEAKDALLGAKHEIHDSLRKGAVMKLRVQLKLNTRGWRNFRKQQCFGNRKDVDAQTHRSGGKAESLRYQGVISWSHLTTDLAKPKREPQRAEG